MKVEDIEETGVEVELEIEGVDKDTASSDRPLHSDDAAWGPCPPDFRPDPPASLLVGMYPCICTGT
jgi:hypothetical protein